VAFTLSFTDFGAPKVVGGQFNILAVDIYKQVIGQQNFGMGGYREHYIADTDRPGLYCGSHCATSRHGNCDGAQRPLRGQGQPCS
jgi:hypothetical protein